MPRFCQQGAGWGTWGTILPVVSRAWIVVIEQDPCTIEGIEIDMTNIVHTLTAPVFRSKAVLCAGHTTQASTTWPWNMAV